ncbi:MAG: GTPase Era [Butyrivibrio sp.]|nr:GTPase Era [Butyrivibrio sp.]
MGAEQFRAGFVTLIGRPNVGKSTLMNQLIGQKIAITSARPQTTRGRILTVYTDEDCQIVFLDTPGLHHSRNKLGEYMVRTARGTLSEVDAVLWLVEAGTVIGSEERAIGELLDKSGKPILLILNKIDTVDATAVTRTAERFLQEFPFIRSVTQVSALKRQRIDEVLQEIRELLPYGPPFYDEETVTEETERAIVSEIIREKALRLLSDEVPHGIAVTVERMRLRDRNGETDPFREPEPEDLMDIEASVICEKDSHKGIVIGKGGRMLKQIGIQARKDIEELLQCRVNLQLFVKVRRDWRDDATQLRSLGYSERRS